MERRRAIPLRMMLVLLAGGFGIAQTPQVAPGPGAQTPAVQSTVPQPSVQPVALTPSQMPPSAPRISYVGGKLTVVANNATLDDVLARVGNAISANIQGIQSQGGERVFGQFGPASPSQVLDTLLTGSRYDFILVGSAGNAGSVREIILSPRSAEPDQAAQFTATQSPPQILSGNDSSSSADNQQQALSPEEQAGFHRNRRGPGARAIVRPQALAPGAATPQQIPAPATPQ
ncbi:MAG TPA: hypothetical protein VG649_14495 [Candidatus Angelobacter sp.]|nr:hypothetical protein [Candidatus Angelobacter sp.]